MRPQKISLIISTYQNPRSLEKVLQGVRRQTQVPGEVLISDDGSEAPTRELVARWRGQMPVELRHLWHEDKGFRKTTILNKSIAAATGNYVVFLDGDCVPHREFIADHLALAEPGFWIQGRRCFVGEKFAPDFDIEKTSVSRWILQGRITGAMKAIRWPRPILRRDCAQRGIIGCNMAFWREDLVAVNGLDEDYSGWGIGEDSDLGTRLYNLGRPRKFVYGRAIVFHLNHPFLPRDHVDASRARLQETIVSRRVRCQKGLDQYFTPELKKDAK